MNAVLIQVLALGLTLSQLFTKPPEQVKLQFNPQTDQAEVEQILKSGCGFVTERFKAGKLNIELLIKMAQDKSIKAKEDAAAKGAAAGAPDGVTKKMAKDMDYDGLLVAYKLYCKNESIAGHGIKLDEVIQFYNSAFKDMPRIDHMKNFKLEESATVLDRNGQRFSEIYSANNRRLFVPFNQIPEHVKKAFVSAEDQNFGKHPGIDVFGIIQAFVNNLMTDGRPNGGSTITQQVVKNLILNDDVTFERKMREAVIATQLEKVLSKDQILELYLNFVYLGRASWGVEMASRSYFGKSVKDIDVAEAALLAGLVQGPNWNSPETQPERAKARRKYVLDRMKEDGLPADAHSAALQKPISIIPFESPHKRGAYYFLDAIRREAKEKGLLGKPYVVRSTIHPELQKLTESSLQDGLVEYETKSGRARWTGTQGSIADDIAKYQVSWKEILPKVKARLYDVPWTLATVLDTKQARVGLADGRVVALRSNAEVLKSLKIYDLVFVVLTESGANTTATLRATPQVQGAVVVLDNKTGQVLSMTGGFSFADKPYNRALDAQRPTGSTLKPFVFLSALNLGYQPNTLLPDVPLSFAPIARGGKVWSPKNYDGKYRGLVTMRRAVEQSINVPTARMMRDMLETPAKGLDYIGEVTRLMGIYEKPEHYYPFILGTQGARVIDMARAYATIANDGLMPTPHFIEGIEDNGKTVPVGTGSELKAVPSSAQVKIDRASFYQMRRILMGTLTRGTATAIKDLSGFVAGKTGTTNDQNDAWFVGFTNDITVAVWIGYDDRHVRANLGDGFTGAKVALPIAEKILRGSFQLYKEKQAFAPAPPEVAAMVADYSIDIVSGQFGTNGQGNFQEVFRRDQSGTRIIDSIYKILRPGEDQTPYGQYSGGDDTFQQDPQFSEQDYWRQQPYNQPRDYYQPGAESQYDYGRRRQRRVDPNLVNPFFQNFPFFGGQQ